MKILALLLLVLWSMAFIPSSLLQLPWLWSYIIWLMSSLNEIIHTKGLEQLLTYNHYLEKSDLIQYSLYISCKHVLNSVKCPCTKVCYFFLLPPKIFIFQKKRLKLEMEASECFCSLVDLTFCFITAMNDDKPQRTQRTKK